MAQRGSTRQILLPPLVHTEVDDSEAFAPVAVELRNGKLSDIGTWVPRPGLAAWYAPLSQVPQNLRRVHAIIPEGPGYFALEGGRVFRILPSPSRVMPGRLLGGERPTWARYRENLILADGGPLFRLEVDNDFDFSAVAGEPGNAKFVVELDTYLILAGYDRLSFKWSDTNTFTVWPEANFNSLTDDGDEIKMLKVHRRELYFFLGKRIEVWFNAGTENTFQRRARIERGTPAGHSVVKANDTYYFLGDDRDFYELAGASPRVIPKQQPRQMRGLLNALNDPSEVYGFDFRKEGIIRWFAPSNGLVFAYDYVHDLFMLESMDVGGVHQMLPIASHGEIKGVTYVGAFEPTGEVRKWTTVANTDLGNRIRMVRRFKVALSGDGTTVRANRLRIRVERGREDNPFILNPKLLVRWAFDGGEPGTPEELKLGPIGQADPYLDILQLGYGRELDLELIESDAVPLHMTQAWITVEALGR